MFQYFIKVLISATIIVLATEISKRSSVLAALIIALPLVSLITFCWIYFETKDTLKIANLSYEILYFGLATIPLFLLLPYNLRIFSANLFLETTGNPAKWKVPKYKLVFLLCDVNIILRIALLIVSAGVGAPISVEVTLI